MLTETQINQYIQSGSLLVDTLLPDDIIDAASEEMDRLYAGSDNPTGIKAYMCEPGFVNVFQHPHLEQVAQQILGCEAVHVLSSATLHTEPNAEQWSYDEATEHVDIQYTLSDWLDLPRRIIITFMIFLDDVNEERAPTVVRPGSHLQLAAYNGEVAFQDHPVNKRDLPDLPYADAQPLCGRKGQVAISTTALIHAGSKNASDKPRKVMFAVFAAADVNPPFNANKLNLRLAWLEHLERAFAADRKHLASSAVQSTRRLAQRYADQYEQQTVEVY